MSRKDPLKEQEKKKLLAAYKTLEKFSEHEFPVLRFNCRKAKNELWQALFELDLLPPEMK